MVSILRHSLAAAACAIALSTPVQADGTAVGLSENELARWQTAYNGLSAMTPKWGIQPVEAFKTTIDAGVPIVMLDVREPAEWAEGVIENAVLVSLTELPTAEGLAMLPEDRQTAMGVYCKSGHRSALALALLHNLGYTNVINMAGGFQAWTKAEYPFVVPTR
ncbi:rhodanese-like domain-containing protein [Loktanella sp. 5RATIMAR09]|uniref:rhodanese-like domain-containing protein n=1 Tax=Loktanella sp. 5RATIMAR09 TaxID=1225655 RepID=UPI000AE66DD9|nr:rhodanese-like domain-containing protein [Loktanella sp. 5RATIMAR09]